MNKLTLLPLLLLGPVLFGQPAPSDAPANEELVMGMTRAEYDQTREELLEAYQDPEVEVLTRKIEKLMEEREKLLLRKTREKYPEHASHVDKIGAEFERQRGKGKGLNKAPDVPPPGGG